MAKANNAAGFVVFEIILAIILVAVVGFAVYQYGQNIRAKTTGQSASKSTVPVSSPRKACLANENESAANGVFCSEGIGIKLTVPSIFKGKLAKAANYEVYQGSIDESPTASVAGTSKNVFVAEIKGNDNYTLTIAEEPLRSGYVGVVNGLQEAYFDKTTGILSDVIHPANLYDSATGTYKKSGATTLGPSAPSFMVGGTRIYQAGLGDAGTLVETYFGVIKGGIIKIEVRHAGYIGDPTKDPSTINVADVLKELDDSVKKLQLL